MKKYFGLMVRDAKTQPWSFEFGSFDRSDVVYERDDWCDHFDDNGKQRRKGNTLIVTFDQCPTDAEIRAMVADFNRPLAAD